MKKKHFTFLALLAVTQTAGTICKNKNLINEEIGAFSQTELEHLRIEITNNVTILLASSDCTTDCCQNWSF